MCNALCIGGHHGTFVVQIVVFAVGAHHAQDGDALGHFDAELAARGLVALHLVDEGMLGKFALQGLGAHAFQVFPNGADTFLFQQGSYFLLRDEAGIYRVFYHQFHVLAHLRGGLAVESCDSHYQVSNDKQQNDRK